MPQSYDEAHDLADAFFPRTCWERAQRALDVAAPLFGRLATDLGIEADAHSSATSPTPLLRISALIVRALSASTSPVLGQAALVHVLAEDTSQPQIGAIVRLVGVESEVSRTNLTDERGKALFVGLPAGRYELTAEMIGMAAAEATPFQVVDGQTVTRVVRLAASPIQLEGLDVELAADRCTVRPSGEGAIVARLWDEARKALSSASVTQW